MDVAKLTKQIEATNALLGQVIPMVGIILPMARMIRELAVRSGADVGTFDQEIQRNSAAVEDLKALIAEFQQAFPS